jgi:hypothetical protein
MVELIRPILPSLHIIDKSLVGYLVASWCGIVAGKIPIAQVFGTGGVQVIDGLVNHFYVGENMIGANYL